MAPLTSSLKRAPKWAWFTAAGVGLGAAAIKVFHDRDKPAEEIETTAGNVIGSPYTGVAASPLPTTVVPPVIIPSQNDQNAGVPVLQELYVNSMKDVLSSWESLTGPLLTTVTQVAMEARPQALQALAMAGGPPVAQASPVIVVNPTPQPAPAPAAKARCGGAYPHDPGNGDCFRVITQTQTERNGAKVWCTCDTIHHHQSGRKVVVAERKAADGPCWVENHPC